MKRFNKDLSAEQWLYCHRGFIRVSDPPVRFSPISNDHQSFLIPQIMSWNFSKSLNIFLQKYSLACVGIIIALFNVLFSALNIFTPSHFAASFAINRLAIGALIASIMVVVGILKVKFNP